MAASAASSSGPVSRSAGIPTSAPDSTSRRTAPRAVASDRPSALQDHVEHGHLERRGHGPLPAGCALEQVPRQGARIGEGPGATAGQEAPEDPVHQDGSTSSSVGSGSRASADAAHSPQPDPRVRHHPDKDGRLVRVHEPGAADRLAQPELRDDHFDAVDPHDAGGSGPFDRTRLWSSAMAAATSSKILAAVGFDVVDGRPEEEDRPR